MKTPKEVREAKTRIVKEGKLIAEMTDHDGWKLLEAKLQSKIEEAKANALISDSFEEFRFRRGFLEGLNSLLQEIDTIISKGKSQEKLLKK